MPIAVGITLIILAGLLTIMLVFYIVVISIVFHITFSRRKGDAHFAENEDPRMKKMPDRVWYFSQKIEEIEMKSHDGLKLKGYFIKNNNSNKLAILVHGYHGRYYSTVSQARIFYENGYNILSINNRVHDTSEGKYLSMGHFEKLDLQNWINLMVKSNPNYEIVLYGISMGAFFVMLTASSLKIPANVKCIVSDCGFSNLKKQLLFALKDTHIPLLKMVMFFLDLHCRIFHHFRINYSLEKELPNLAIPILLVHGNVDQIVPFENLKINYDSVNPNVYKKMVEFEGAKHTRCVEQKDKFTKEVNEFVNQFIK